ncbi:MAG: ABC transporter substrate-binding protein [Gammaproteobacteria bacterium]|nr:ABC transporter substrate-binding protein [Gammaproteobacteria bacterium]NIM72801.1 ABC transporter substrate-binding protein [Gammaproteobacteria bacterium]NIN38258.1 ABC transporter substrate-binding protein [Gammaproteobacteria bacterium]NIO24549.1 ABC transporter substrate-binding protein [Gammaproteobacteria bacterium]NIO65158.1 ABC transporter substrate-binding protein [Gammaproteobacteria bacterium]
MGQCHVMVTRHSSFYTPLLVTIGGGFLAAEGLEAKFSIAETPRDVLAGVHDGSVQVAQSAVSANFGALERGKRSPLVHFAQINERDGFVLVGREADDAFTWEKLKGKKIIVDHGRQPLAMFRFALHKEGVDFETLEAIDAGNPQAMEQAFRAGQGDYVHLQGPAAQQLTLEGVGHVVAWCGNSIGPVAFSSLAASRAWLQSPDAGTFMRAYRRAREFAIEMDPDEVASVVGRYFNEVDRDALIESVQGYQALGCWSPEVRISPEAFTKTLEVFARSGHITKRHPYEQVCVEPPGDE